MKEKNKPAPGVKAESAASSASSNQNKLVRAVLPHVIAIAIFAFVTVLFFSPMLIDNKVIEQSDILQGKGMSKEIVDFRNATGKEPLWTNSMFGGMPAFQISVLYKGNL